LTIFHSLSDFVTFNLFLETMSRLDGKRGDVPVSFPLAIPYDRFTERHGNRMKKWITALVLMGIFLGMETGSFSHAQQRLSREEALRRAREIATGLGDDIRSMLNREIERGGLSSAIRVCSEQAQEKTDEFSARAGHYAKRVSLKIRNPKNTPDADERRKLETFAILKQQNRLEQEYADVVTDSAGEYLHYMKPLIVVDLCTRCHGAREAISPEVTSVLAERYPHDQATGFAVGDIRGAISVKIRLSPS
jgi:hypothetical protein